MPVLVVVNIAICILRNLATHVSQGFLTMFLRILKMFFKRGCSPPERSMPVLVEFLAAARCAIARRRGTIRAASCEPLARHHQQAVRLFELSLRIFGLVTRHAVEGGRELAGDDIGQELGCPTFQH